MRRRRKETSILLSPCTNELLKQLSKTNPSLYFVPEIMYQSQLYNASSINSFCREQTFVYDLNLSNTRLELPAVFMLLVAGVMVPSIAETDESKEKFVAMVNQMETEHEE